MIIKPRNCKTVSWKNRSDSLMEKATCIFQVLAHEHFWFWQFDHLKYQSQIILMIIIVNHIEQNHRHLWKQCPAVSRLLPMGEIWKGQNPDTLRTIITAVWHWIFTIGDITPHIICLYYLRASLSIRSTIILFKYLARLYFAITPRSAWMEGACFWYLVYVLTWKPEPILWLSAKNCVRSIDWGKRRSKLSSTTVGILQWNSKCL